MKVVSIPAGMRRGIAYAGDDEFASIDYTSPPHSARRRRRRPEEDVGNPSTIFPKAPSVQDYVSKRNPHGTEYVQQLIGRIDSRRNPHELDERRKEGAESDGQRGGKRDALPEHSRSHGRRGGFHARSVPFPSG